MSKIIRTQYDGSCRTCKSPIEQGDNVRWTKGVKGVVCMSCPDDTAAPATNANANAEIKQLNDRLAAAKDKFRQQRAEIETLKATLAQVTCERDEARARLIEPTLVEGCDDASLVDPDSINVMAPGGVEAWLAADAAQRAATGEPCACIGQLPPIDCVHTADDDFPL
jgi:hypothetical protein